MMKDSPTPSVEHQEEPSPDEETMDLSWKGATSKLGEREEKEEEEKEEEEEFCRQTDHEDDDGEGSQSGGPVTDLSWKGAPSKLGEREEKEEEEEEKEEEEELSRQADPEDDDEEGSQSGGPVAAERLVKKEREEDGEDTKVDDHAMDGEDGVEKEDDSGDYGEEDMFVDTQDSPINYATYDSATPQEGGSLAGWNGSQRAGQGSKLTCDICGLACVSLNVLLVHKRSHTGERPFHCQQCGASFTQKGNLLRHIKLHSGEKPFKCPMCNYACRRRDALSGHLRTHSVEKPYKCNHCGRSYKQRSSLEEHRERCHVYMQIKNESERAPEDVSSNGARAQGGVERAILLDRLASNVAKRKRTMPQKFVGENPVCLDLCFKRESGVSSDAAQSSSNPEVLPGTPSDMDQPPNRSFPLQLTAAPLTLTNGCKLERPAPCLPHPTPGSGHLPLDSPHHPDGGPRSRYASDPHRRGLLHLHHPPQQQQQQQQQQQLPFNLSHLLAPGPPNGLPFPLHHHHHPALAPPPPSLPHAGPEVLRVVQGKGEPVGAYMCGHCRVLFLDYVMFTIHMGCHGFRDPLECNVCGHLSQDRYEFSSHIARGEHYLEVK